MSTDPVPLQTERRLALASTDLSLLFIVVIWGFNYVTFRVGQRDLTAGLFNLVRFGVATPLLWISLLNTKEDWRLPRRHWGRAIAIGVIGVFLYSMLLTVASKLTTAANLSLLMALSPMWGAVIVWTVGKGFPGTRFLIGSLVACAGAALVIAFGASKLTLNASSLRGDMLGIAVAVLWAWYGIHAGPLLQEHSPLKVQAWINLIGLVGFVLYQGPTAWQFDWSSVTAVSWVSVLEVAVLGTVVCYTLWYWALGRVGSGRAMLAMYLVPVLAAAFGALFLGQAFGLVQVLGAAVALCGVALVRTSTT